MKRSICFYLFVLTSIGFADAQTKWEKVREQLLFSSPPFKSCHASTIVEDKKGGVSIACFAGSQEGKDDVSIFFGRIPKTGNVIPKEAANGVDSAQHRYPCWNPVLFKKRNGQLVLFYKVGPNPREWWGMYKISNDEGLHWSKAIQLPDNVLGPIKNKAVEIANGEILCPSSVELNNGHWKVQMEITDQDLRKWTVVPVDTGSTFDVIQPSVLFYGTQLQALMRSKQGNIVQSWSTDNGRTWTQLSKTSLANPNSGIDAVTLKDGMQLVVYNPDVPGKDWFNGRARLRVATSVDGVNWQDILVLENGTTEEYSYPAIIQTSDGLVHISYTYDRKNIKYVVLREKK